MFRNINIRKKPKNENEDGEQDDIDGGTSLESSQDPSDTASTSTSTSKRPQPKQPTTRGGNKKTPTKSPAKKSGKSQSTSTKNVSPKIDRPLNVLIVNDDSIEAPGIQAIVHALAKYPKEFNIRVFAPTEQQSGVSHHISIHSPIKIAQYVSPAYKCKAYAVYGTPADCVKIAMCKHYLPDFLPELVVSGINKGLNSGLNPIYSGTCAASAEAAIHGVPAVALSLMEPPDLGSYIAGQDRSTDWKFHQAATISVELIKGIRDAIYSRQFPKYCYLNVNIPSVNRVALKGVALCVQGKNQYLEDFEYNSCKKVPINLEGAVNSTWTTYDVGGRMIYPIKEDNFDCVLSSQNWVTACPLSVSFFNPDVVNTMWNPVSQWTLWEQNISGLPVEIFPPKNIDTGYSLDTMISTSFKVATVAFLSGIGLAWLSISGVPKWAEKHNIKEKWANFNFDDWTSISAFSSTSTSSSTSNKTKRR